MVFQDCKLSAIVLISCIAIGFRSPEEKNNTRDLSLVLTHIQESVPSFSSLADYYDHAGVVIGDGEPDHDKMMLLMFHHHYIFHWSIGSIKSC